MSRPRARTFSTPLLDRCTGCKVGQGRVCACRVRQAQRRIPTPVLMLAIYGGSVALVVGVAVWLWRAWV